MPKSFENPTEDTSEGIYIHGDKLLKIKKGRQGISEVTEIDPENPNRIEGYENIEALDKADPTGKKREEFYDNATIDAIRMAADQQEQGEVLYESPEYKKIKANQDLNEKLSGNSPDQLKKFQL